MKRKVFAWLGIALLIMSTEALAAPGTQLTCALTKAYVCSSDEGCMTAAPRDLDLPRFIRIDFEKKVIASLDRSVQRGDTSFVSVDRIEGMTIIHGVEKLGWSMAIGEQSGDLTISASGDGEGFTIFGSCITP